MPKFADDLIPIIQHLGASVLPISSTQTQRGTSFPCREDPSRSDIASVWSRFTEITSVGLVAEGISRVYVSLIRCIMDGFLGVGIELFLGLLDSLDEVDQRLRVPITEPMERS